jgi:uncharacterized membrane protein YfcA
MPLPEVTPLVVAVAIVAYMIGGIAKGVAGLGLAAITVPVMALVVSLEVAIGVAILPAIVTSVWQGLAGGALRKVVRRTWTFFLPCCLSIFLGAQLLARVDRSLLTTILGVLLGGYAAYALTRPRLPELGRHETWLSPVVGAISGVVGGATGSFVMPAAPYVQLLKLSRDELVQAIGVMALLWMPTLALALGRNELFDDALGLTSLALLVPTMAGLALGTLLRRWISEATFKMVFFWTLLALGTTIVGRNLVGAA